MVCLMLSAVKSENNQKSVEEVKLSEISYNQR